MEVQTALCGRCGHMVLEHDDARAIYAGFHPEGCTGEFSCDCPSFIEGGGWVWVTESEVGRLVGAAI